MKRSVLMKLTACCMTGAMVLGSTGVVTMASGLDSALAGMGAEIADSQQQKEVVKVAPSGYDTVAIAQVDEYVNIRDAASTEGNVVGKLYNNCKAEILGKTDDGWYLIQSGEVTGYVSSDYFVTGSQAEALAQEVGTDMATVKGGTETLMVRSSADSNSEAISMVGDSEKLRVLEDDGDWVKVAVDDDVEGYVSKEYVDCDTEFVEAESVEQAEARKAAVQAALDKATQMQEAAYAAMNAADGNEAAYAADQANAALAEAKMLASEQEYDYEIQDLTDQIAYVAQDTSVASVWAQEAQAEEERIAAEKAAQEAAEAQAAADAAAQTAAASQASADSQEQEAQQKEQAAADAWQAAVDAQNQADQNWSEEAQAEADAAAQAAIEAAAAAEAARQQAEAEAAAAEAARQQAEAEAAAKAEQEAQQKAQQNQQDGNYDDGSSYDNSSSSSSDSSSSDSSSSSSSSSIRQSVVSYALQFVGNPYVYGGTSLTNGADCSGFVLSVMANFGISLPRTAASQSTVGTPVSLDSIQPGDLLFYQGSGGIGHVTMYIGNGQVVHASNPSTGITVSSIDYRTPCCARSFF